MIELYTAATGNGRRATLMMEESGLPYVAHKVEVGKGAQKPAALLEINPEGTVPVIVDRNGPAEHRIVLRQSAAILFYVAEKSGRLLSQEPAARAATLEWTLFAMTDIVGANTAMYQVMTDVPEAEQAAGYFRSKLVEFLQVCDRRLRDSEYLAGAQISIADLALFPVLVSRRAIVEASPGLDNFKRWGQRIGARPAVQRVLAMES
jgi:GST-like protein